MKGTVNPFEPWRPVAGRIPPPLHVSRPWRPPPPPPVRAAVEEPPLIPGHAPPQNKPQKRPQAKMARTSAWDRPISPLYEAVEEPPFVEPVKPLPRNKPPERPKQPQRQAGQPSPRRLPISQWTLALVVLCFLSFPGIVGACGTHAARMLPLGVSAIIFAGMAFENRRSWSTRLAWMVAATAFAAIALWFVPTMHGVNLWSAYRQIEELHALPAGDVAAYQRGAAARRTLVEDFPSFAWDVRAAEKAWLRRTVDEAIENADRRLDKDPDAALVHLHQLDKELSRLDHYASVSKDLKSARRRAVQACVKVVQQP